MSEISRNLRVYFNGPTLRVRVLTVQRTSPASRQCPECSGDLIRVPICPNLPGDQTRRAPGVSDLLWWAGHATGK